MAIKHIKSSKVVGIDFGTTFSSICWFNNDHTEYVCLDNKKLINSSIWYEDNEISINKQEKCIKNLKMYISDPSQNYNPDIEYRLKHGIPELKIGNNYKNIIQIMSDFLRIVRHKTNQYFNEDIKNAVMTMPARFNEIQKQWITQAAINAGWTIIRIVSEPTAAFLAQRNLSDGIYGICDLGGGTFDFSIVRKQSDIVQILATNGDLNIGAEKFNQIVSIDNKIEFIQKIIDICDREIYKSGLNMQQIILVGGGCNIHLLKQMLEEKYTVICAPEPQLSVARGAAIYADSLIQKKQCLLLDVAPLSLGIKMHNYTVEWLIHRNTPLPTSQYVILTNISPKQTHISLEIMQGEGSFADQCQSIAILEIPIIQSPINSVEIKVVFLLDHNNMLSIKAINLRDNKLYNIIVDTKKGLTLDLVQQMHTMQEINTNNKIARALYDVNQILMKLPSKDVTEMRHLYNNVQCLESAQKLLQDAKKRLYLIEHGIIVSTAQKIYDEQYVD